MTVEALPALLRKSLIFGLFRAVPVFSGINGGDGDGGDERRVAVNIGVAFGKLADGNCGGMWLISTANAVS